MKSLALILIILSAALGSKAQQNSIEIATPKLSIDNASYHNSLGVLVPAFDFYYNRKLSNKFSGIAGLGIELHKYESGPSNVSRGINFKRQKLLAGLRYYLSKKNSAVKMFIQEDFSFYKWTNDHWQYGGIAARGSEHFDKGYGLGAVTLFGVETRLSNKLYFIANTASEIGPRWYESNSYYYELEYANGVYTRKGDRAITQEKNVYLNLLQIEFRLGYRF